MSDASREADGYKVERSSADQHTAGEQGAENDVPFAHDDDGNLIAVTCAKCGTVVAVGHAHECVIPPAVPATPDAGDASEPEWFEGGDGHGYRYQYIGPIHYLGECGDSFLNRDRWVAHKARAEERERIAQAIEAQVRAFGQAEPGDPVRAGLIEGYRDAVRIARLAPDTAGGDR